MFGKEVTRRVGDVKYIFASQMSSIKSMSNTAKEAKAVFKNNYGDENYGGENRKIQLLLGLLQGYGTDEEIAIKSN